MTKFFTLGLLCAASCWPLLGFSQAASLQAIPMGQLIRKKLPDDLPQQKLLFVRYSPVTLPATPPRMFTAERGVYKLQENHNAVIPKSNEQLVEAAARYPFAYRITTLDSVTYYRDHGYKYMLMQSSFNSGVDGTYRGTRGHGMGASRTYTSTSVDLYVQNLQNGDRYVFDDFSQTFIYYYKGQVGMLLKKVDKQFDAKKKS